MKLSKLWKNHKITTQPDTIHDKKNFPFSLLEKGLLVSLVIVILFSTYMCEEEKPVLQVDNPPVSFEYIGVDSDFFSDLTYLAEPKLGSSSQLTVGNTEIANMITLIRFSDFYYLPEGLDSVTSLWLELKTLEPILFNENQNNNITVSLLGGNAGVNWSEESTNRNNFTLDDYKIIPLDTCEFLADSTLKYSLPDTLIYDWLDTTTVNCGLLVQYNNSEQKAILPFYSKESSYPPTLLVEYTEDDSSISKTVYATEDLSIVSYSQEDIPNERLMVSSGRAYGSYIHFCIPDSIIDKRNLIAKALLHLSIDTLITRNYDGNFTLYLTVLDSNILESDLSDLSTFSTINVSKTIVKEDTSIVLEIDRMVQRFNSGYDENFGVALWAPPFTLSVSELGIFSSSSTCVGKRPYLELLIMKEEW